MSVTTTTHLNFRGEARQALEFYQSVFGGRLMIATYGQFGVPQDDPDGGPSGFAPLPPGAPDADRVAFGVVTGENGFRVAAYDVFGSTGEGLAGTGAATGRRAGGLTHDESLFLMLNGDTLEDLSGPWKALSEGGTVIAPLPSAGETSPYSMLTDRFGVTWIFGVTPAH
ncbi:VOC family protein [Amycolatopsis sp. PS_44_ISF1]|uniref:VOC family protein n=1 Tax=Amycolatopsis sp. PS_44_ISF1 TaxID=2974917 RepID=UPI0028DF203D|nr:VOC family protein [Amycolatopsis sp. PS_44_ISF1]MDT8911977.1 VOC family protein [Amycolatopsis sp. PS_44_ISF1]